jgi:type I restriction enzyme, R subunit
MTNEAFARVKIDALLAAQGWDALDTNAVRFEVQTSPRLVSLRR